MMNFSRLNQINKLEDQKTYDLLIIGGGVVGAAALEMASNANINSILIEKNDFASGASSRSTKLLHGGIRYLPQFHFDLVRESLQEQRILKKLIGNLYIPLKLLAPLYRDDGFSDLPKVFQANPIAAIAFKIGLTLYDFLGSRKKTEKHTSISIKKTKEMFPLLMRKKLIKSFVFQDAQTDDAKLVLTLLRNAVEVNNATAINYIEITNVEKKEDDYLITLNEKIKKKRYQITTKKIIAATGIHTLPGDYASKSSNIKYSGGAHLILKGDPLKINNNGILLPRTEDERVMFVLPWFGNTIVGTTDTEVFSGTLDIPYANKDDINYLKRHVIKYFNIQDPTYVSSWSGVRALIDESSTSSKNISRGHFINKVDRNFVQIAGGKLTGFRLIALESLESLYNKGFKLNELKFVDEILNLRNNYHQEDLETCIKHYSVAKPTDYMLRRTHISWFIERGGMKMVDSISENFVIPNIKDETIEELKAEGLV